MFAVTMPHHTPVKPQPRTEAKISISGGVIMIVLRIVTANAFIPLPVPWNMDEENAPAAAAG